MLIVVQHTNALCGQSAKILNFQSGCTCSSQCALTGYLKIATSPWFVLICDVFSDLFHLYFISWTINCLSITHNLFYLKGQFVEGSKH